MQLTDRKFRAHGKTGPTPQFRKKRDGCQGEGFYCADGLCAEWKRAIRQTRNLSANSGNLNSGQVSPRPGAGDVTGSGPAHRCWRRDSDSGEDPDSPANRQAHRSFPLPTIGFYCSFIWIDSWRWFFFLPSDISHLSKSVFTSFFFSSFFFSFSFSFSSFSFIRWKFILLESTDLVASIQVPFSSCVGLRVLPIQRRWWFSCTFIGFDKHFGIGLTNTNNSTMKLNLTPSNAAEGHFMATSQPATWKKKKSIGFDSSPSRSQRFVTEETKRSPMELHATGCRWIAAPLTAN